jgi:hypothetical protein
MPSSVASTAIYFAGSIRGGRSDRFFYHAAIERIQNFSPRVFVPTKHVGALEEGVVPDCELQLTDSDIWVRDMAWLADSAAVIADISTPSHGVGYEIARAEAQGIPVLCLWREDPPRRPSAMLTGSPKIQTVVYSDEAEALAAIDAFMQTHFATLQDD